MGVSRPEMPIFVSYFTDAFYMREAFELVRTMQIVGGLDYDIRRVGNLGNWGANTNHKPTFLLEMAREYPDRAICWLDADARFRSFPWLFFETIDAPIAYHTWVPGGNQWGRPGALSGTVYLGVCADRIKLVEAWRDEVLAHPEATDQVCMSAVVNALQIRRVELPVEYVWIYDLAQKTLEPNPDAPFHPVIEQMQASRWRKRMRQDP